MPKIKECECCRKEIEITSNQKLCSRCRLYTRTLRNKLYGYKSQLKKCRKRFYGVENGSERFRERPEELKNRKKKNDN